MKRLLSIFALLTAASMLLWFAGCGGDEEEEEVNPPTFESWSITEGSEVAGNASISANLSSKPDEATITVTGATGTTTIAGKVITWVPTGDIPPGAHTATISASNAGGDVEGALPLNFTAIAPDVTPPALATCDPKDKASGVNPEDYPENITVGFSEAVTATIISKDPDFKSTEEMSADGKTMTISFLQYTMPNETPFEIVIQATDQSNNTSELTYTFETMAKEQ